MQKAIVFIDYDYLCEYEDAHPESDDNAAFLDIAKSFEGIKDLSFDECCEDYFILDSRIPEAAAREIIEDRFRRTLEVKSLEGIVKGIEFWPKERHAHVLDVPEEVLYKAFDNPIKPQVSKQVPYIIHCYFNTNFSEDYEENFNLLWHEGLGMPMRQLAKELEKIDGVRILNCEMDGIRVRCERVVKEVSKFIERRLAALAGSDDLWGIGFLTVYKEE